MLSTKVHFLTRVTRRADERDAVRLPLGTRPIVGALSRRLPVSRLGREVGRIGPNAEHGIIRRDRFELADGSSAVDW